MLNSTDQKWQPASNGTPCPICKKANWCSVETSGNTVICMRVKSELQASSGGWVHKLEQKTEEEAE